MYSASDYRSMARRALKNYWWLAVGVTLLASILGGTSSGFTPSFSLTVNGDDLTQYYPETLRHALRVFLPVSGIISLAQFVIGGSVSIGHNRFCLKLVDGEEARFEDLFSGFDIFGNAFVLNLLITLKVLAWSLLFVIPGIVAAYRYRFALYNLYENPGIGVMEALNMSKQQTLGYKGQLFMLDLSYIGWFILASLTSVVQTGYIYACIFQDPGYYLANPARVYAITLPMPVGLQVVLGCVWPLLVALFYLPVYQCTELGYFDTAKHTSGVGEGAAPKDPGSFDSGWGGF